MTICEKKMTWEPIEFDCRYCGKHVRTAGYVNGRPDKRSVFCCEEHQIKYWKHHYRMNGAK